MAAPISVAELLELVQQSLPLDPARLDTYVAGLRRGAALPGRAGDLAGLLVRDGFLTPFQAEHLLRGRRPKFIIGRYLILDRLGAGGMGAVYLCEHLQLGRQVALKVLPADQADDPVARDRFTREAQAVAALDHPNIVRAYDVDVEGRTCFLVMEYVDGVDLQELVSRFGPLDVARAAHYVRQAAEGLQHAHEARLVHRDVKPANLLLSRAGVVKVLDLGLARFFHEGADSVTERHADQSILGTADYLSPEQARDSSDVDIRADIYSLGATFYFLLAGKPPFGDGTLNQKLLWHQMKPPPPLRALRPEVPEAMAAVVLRMMAKDPAARFQTPADVAAALAPWTRTPLPSPAPAEMPPPRSAMKAGRPWRKDLPSAGSTVVQRAARATAGTSPSTTPNLPPTAPRMAMPSMELPSAPRRAAPVPQPAPAPSSPPASVPQPAGDDWSRLFDEEPTAAVTPTPAPARRAVVRQSTPSRRVILAAAVPAIVLLVGGVCLVIWCLTGTPRPTPTPPASAPVTAAPAAPRGPTHLRAVLKGPDTIELTWDDPHGPSTGFHVERATDRYFTRNVVTSNAPGDARRYTDSKLAPNASYYYRVRAERGPGDSAVSDAAWPPPDYSQGFTPNGLSLNGGAAVVDKALRLTDQNGNEARSAFYRQEVDVRSFATKFRFRISPGATADGFTFCVQGGDPTALGQPAAGLGYQDIPKSVAVKFDLWSNDNEGPNSTGLFLDGAKPSNPGAIDLTPSGIDLHGGRAYDAAIKYKDGAMVLSVTDAEDATKQFKTTFRVDVPARVGGATAYAGFTGGTGGFGAVQDVLTWTWESTGE